MHAERCPVCNGGGVLYTTFMHAPCHGCGQRGWVAVQDMVDLIPKPPEPRDITLQGEASAPSVQENVFQLTPGLVRRLLSEGQIKVTRTGDAQYTVTAVGIGHLLITDPDA